MESRIEAKPLFAATLTPQRALGPRGRRIAVGIIAVLTALSVLVLSRFGLWPILAFLALDAFGVWWALGGSGRKDRACEEVTLWPRTLEVRQVSASGHEESVSFDPAIVRLVVDRDYEERITAIRLKTAERDLELGAFLSPDDRASFSQALGTALRKARA